jgi:hypothetical protein
MRTTTWGGIAVLVALVVLVAPAGVQASEILLSADHRVSTVEDATLYNYTGDRSFGIPISVNMTYDGASATTTLTRTQSAFDAVFAHAQPGVAHIVAESWGTDVFTVDTPTRYALSGTYTTAGPGGVYYRVGLTEDGGVLELFRNTQWDTGNAGQTFIVGGQAGNVADDLYGSQTGTLFPGHTYFWYYNVSIGYGGPGLSATAAGNAEISFTPAEPVPEPPASVLVWSLLGGVGLIGAASAAGGRWRKPVGQP